MLLIVNKGARVYLAKAANLASCVHGSWCVGTAKYDGQQLVAFTQGLVLLSLQLTLPHTCSTVR